MPAGALSILTCLKKLILSTPTRFVCNVRFLLTFKPRVHCFSMQVVMNKYFLLNSEKKLAQIRLVVFEKNAKNAPLIPKNDVTEPKARIL